VLPDGTYDVLVVDADDEGDGVRLDLTVLAGAHKGEMITITAHGLGRDPIDLLALPGTVVVADGTPALTLEG